PCVVTGRRLRSQDDERRPAFTSDRGASVMAVRKTLSAAEEGDHASLRPAHARTAGEQNAAMTERLLVSPAESTGAGLTFVSVSLATSSASTDLTTLAQRSTQAFDMALCCWPAPPEKLLHAT